MDWSFGSFSHSHHWLPVHCRIQDLFSILHFSLVRALSTCLITYVYTPARSLCSSSDTLIVFVIQSAVLAYHIIRVHLFRITASPPLPHPHPLRYTMVKESTQNAAFAPARKAVSLLSRLFIVYICIYFHQQEKLCLFCVFVYFKGIFVNPFELCLSFVNSILCYIL